MWIRGNIILQVTENKLLAGSSASLFSDNVYSVCNSNALSLINLTSYVFLLDWKLLFCLFEKNC